jgi:hypothetical protein
VATQGTSHAGDDRTPGSPDASWEHRLETPDARIEHLERALERRQDGLCRRAMLEDENISELRRRTEPDQMARDLSQDARKRGL